MSNYDEQNKSAALTGYERSLVNKLSDNPMELFSGRTVGWLEDFIRITVDANRSQFFEVTPGSGQFVPGDMKLIATDLSSISGEYVYNDASGDWLYLNGAEVSQTTYADLYAFFGVNAYGTDAGGNFFLPDTRGRAPFCCGTHANTDLGDNDGVALSARQAYHQHTTVSVSVTGTTSTDSAGTPTGSVSVTGASAGTPGGSVTVTDASAGTPTGSVSASFTGSAMGTHTHTDGGHGHTFTGSGSYIMLPSPGPGGSSASGYTSGDRTPQEGWAPSGSISTGTANISSNSAGTPAGSVSASFTGSALSNHGHSASFTGSALGSHGHTASFTGSALSTHGHTFSGTGSGSAGSGMSSDGPAHIYIGSLVVRF